MTDARPVVVVVGLGPAGPDLVTAETLDLVGSTPVRFLRTARHPSAALVAGAVTFDHVYEEATTLDEVYARIVELLVAAAREHRRIVYAVPGSPAVAERTVELLLADERVEVDVRAALSFLDLTWARLGIDPIATGTRVVDGHRFESEAAGERGPLLVAQCDSTDVLSAVKLAIADAIETQSALGGGLARRGDPTGPQRGAGHLPDDLRVTVLQRLGLADERIVAVAWADLDRVVDPDHLTSLWIPAYAAPVAREVQRFAELVATLRRECPWDREQTHATLKRHLLEEAYEVLDAIDHVDPDAATGYEHLEEELGDLLFQVVFHATLAAEAGQFTLADVARGIHDKLYGRHPHVFGAVDATSAEQVAANWEELKRAEKGRASVFDGIPDALPSLLYALKIQKKAAALALGSTLVGDAGAAGDATDAAAAVAGDAGAAAGGTATPIPDVAAAVAGATRTPEAATIGDLLFAVVDLARRAGVDPESALRAAARAHRDALDPPRDG